MIRVDGARIPPPRRHLYLVLNKPRGVVSTMDDPEGRRTLADLLVGKVPGRRSANERLFHVGRLDTETEGLLILTNDGDFGHRLAHPSYEVPKTYLAEVEGVVTPHTLARLRQGVTLEDGPVRPTSVKIVSSAGGEDTGQDHIDRGSESRSCAVRWRRSAIRCAGCRGPRIGPVRLGDPEGRGVPRADPRRARCAAGPTGG